MTINKCQAKYFLLVGLYLSRFVFSYGQFYVAFFKLHFRKGFKLENNESMFKNCTINVVY